MLNSNLNTSSLLELLTYLGNTVISLVAVNPDGELTFFNTGNSELR